MTGELTIKNMSFAYSGSTSKLFNQFDLQIEKGEWIALVGENGSGKSTLVKLMVELLEPSAGTIKTTGKIGMVFQRPDNQFVGATVADDVAFGLENNQISPAEMQPRIEAALQSVGMMDFANRDPHSLSGGQKQRAALASVLALEPATIILDEATAMLDPAGKQNVQETLKALKAQRPELTIIMVTHDMDEALLADRMLVLNHGELVADDQPWQVLNDEQLLSDNQLSYPFDLALQKQLAQQDLKPKRSIKTQKALQTWLSSLTK